MSRSQAAMPVQKTAGRRRPSADRNARAVTAVLRAADRLRRHFTALAEPAGLTFQQYNVLRILRGAGQPLPTMEIRQRMLEQAPGITRILDRLVAKGLVERELPAEDRRRVLCRITRQGLRLLERLDPAMDAADARAFAGVGRRQLDDLVGRLASVERNLAGE